MRLVSYNILDGGLGRADPLAEILSAQHADIVCLLEADDCAVVERIARRLRMDYVIGAGGRHAAAILSRPAIRASWNFAALGGDFLNSFLLAEVQLVGKVAYVGAVHLRPYASVKEEQERVREVESLLRLTRRIEGPLLLAGDFNANSPVQQIDPRRCKPATQKAWEDNGGLLPREAVSRLLEAGFLDTFHAVKEEAAKTLGTFSTHAPGQRVDYIFARGIGRSSIKDAWVECDRLATFASDHYPVGVAWE